MRKRKKLKAIILGGSGFLGSHICDELSANGYKTTIFDKKKSQYIKTNQKMFIGDITNSKDVNIAVKNQNFVFHFAGVSDIDECNRNPLKAIRSNIIGTTNILEAIKKNKNIKKFIFASSIYARSKQGGFYSTTKRTCESLIEDYSQKYNINYIILRFGSLYGLRANNLNSIHKLIYQGFKYKKIEREGNGLEIRNYINAKDAAKICEEILKKKYICKYFNIEGKESISIKSVIKLIANKIRINKVFYNKKKISNYHYKINPYTYKVKEAKKFRLKKSIKLSTGISEIVENLKNKDE